MNKYSFSTLFDKPIEIDDTNSVIISKVEIPRIQRDYAQGRIVQKDNKPVFNEKGCRFIERVFDNLKSNTKMEMDFVYGAIQEVHVNKQKFNILLPLDGQQRLTTLFLLYWYLGNRELEDKTQLFVLLKKFSYETRTSSRRFCEKISERLSIDFNKGILSEQLKDCSWFAKSYEHDPTIKAMLSMIDKIHELYGDSKLNIYCNLENLRFSILPLNQFNLTDELYIKMNARGKQLTEFENFKADLISWMKANEDFNQTVVHGGRKMPYYMAFSNKIDIDWTNLLWDTTKCYDENSKNKKGELIYPMGKLVDPLFLSIFYRWFLFEYIFKSSSNNKEIDKEESFKFLEKEELFSSISPFKSLLSKTFFQEFETIMDKFSSNAQEILDNANASWDNKKANFLLEKGITQPQRVVLFGVFLYLKKWTFDVSKFKQWMRVVWNIVENTDIDSWRSAIGVLELIKELSEYSDDIHAKFPESVKSQSSQNAVAEERLKIKYIKSNPDWEQTFVEAEKHLFLKGSIGFLMTSEMKISDFKHRTQLANLLFDNKGFSEKFRNDHILLRAIISKYTKFEQIRDRSFTDTDDKEHYLKKMLASDQIARESLANWCSLADETEVLSSLNSAIKTSSCMENISNKFESKMHEDLYFHSEMQKWMQEKGAIRFAHYWQDCYYIYRPKSWYDWILVDSFRDKIINELVNQYGCEQVNQVDTSKYHWGGTLSIHRTVNKGANMYDFVYEFSPNGDLRVGIKETDGIKTSLANAKFSAGDTANGWICRKKYNYKDVVSVADVPIFLSKIEKDVFDDKNSDTLFYILP